MITKDLKKKEPDYVLQPNEISRAIYNLKPYARKLLAMAMSRVDFLADEYHTAFAAEDFIKELGIERGGEQIKYIKAALEECASSFIKIDVEGRFEVIPWLQRGEFKSEIIPVDLKNKEPVFNIIRIVFNIELGNLLKKLFEQGYTNLNLINLGKLQSRYAIRFYEIALSFSGFSGKEGNEKNEWFFDMSLEDIRIRFDIDRKRYPRTGDFRINIIDNPIEEINAAKIGIRIDVEYIRKSRWLRGARFHCRRIKNGDPLPAEPATETEKEMAALAAKYPDKFEKHLNNARKEGVFTEIIPPENFEASCRRLAFKRLKEELEQRAGKKAQKKGGYKNTK